MCYIKELSRTVFKPKERKALQRRLADVRGWVCWYCAIPVNPSRCHIDHVEPKSAGGDDGFFNLALACNQCNWAKHTLTKEEYIHWLDWVRSDKSQTLF